METSLTRPDVSRAWLADRFTAMVQDIVTMWDIAQDIAASWTEGRNVSALPECGDEKNNRIKWPGQVFREWLVLVDSDKPGIDRPEHRRQDALQLGHILFGGRRPIRRVDHQRPEIHIDHVHHVDLAGGMVGVDVPGDPGPATELSSVACGEI